MKYGAACILIALIFFSLTSCTGGGKLSVTDAWARPGVMGDNSAVYFTINNPTGQEESLVKASSAIAQAVELHMSMAGSEGTMMMQPQAEVKIPARGKISFEPGGLHVMLIDLPNDLNVGDQFELTLTFKNAGDQKVQVTVREP